MPPTSQRTGAVLYAVHRGQCRTAGRQQSPAGSARSQCIHGSIAAKPCRHITCVRVRVRVRNAQTLLGVSETDRFRSLRGGKMQPRYELAGHASHRHPAAEICISTIIIIITTIIIIIRVCSTQRFSRALTSARSACVNTTLCLHAASYDRYDYTTFPE